MNKINEELKNNLHAEYISLQEESEKEYDAYRAIKYNTFGERFITFFGCSMLTFVPSLLAIAIFGIPAVDIPQLIPVVLFGGSMGIGAIVNGILEKTVFKLKDRLKKITSSKKQIDLLEEAMEHQIKYEIANNKKNVIQQVIENINKKNKLLSSISPNYIVKYNNNLTVDEITKKINDLKEKLSKAFDELSISTRRNILSDSFWRSRDKFQVFIDATIFPVAIAIFLMIMWNFPIFASAGSVNTLNLLLPFPIAQILGAGYIIKRTKDNKKVFNKLNNELKENAISIKRNYEEEKKLQKEVEDQIQNICVIYTELIEQQELLSSKKLEDNQKSKQSKKQKAKGISSFKKIIDGEPINKNPLTVISEPIMSLFGIHSYYFDTKEELKVFCKEKKYLLEDAYKLEYLGNVADRSDVIRKTTRDGKSILYSAADEDGYAIYNHERSVYRGEFIWEFNYGQIREIYKPFRDRGIIFNNDVYAKIDEYYKNIASMINENYESAKNEKKSPQLTKKYK